MLVTNFVGEPAASQLLNKTQFHSPHTGMSSFFGWSKKMTYNTEAQPDSLTV
jgi:hypothetical protein